MSETGKELPLRGWTIYLTGRFGNRIHAEVAVLIEAAGAVCVHGDWMTPETKEVVVS